MPRRPHTVEDVTVGGRRAFEYETAPGIFNRLIRVEDSYAEATTLAYAGPITAETPTVTTPEGRTTTVTTDTRGRTATVVDVFGAVASYAYHDTTGEQDGHLASMEVAGASGLEPERLTAFTYTPEGYLDTVTDAEGRVSDVDYDAHGRVSIQHLPGGTDAVAFAYDEDGRLRFLTPPGRPAHEYRYDAVDKTESLQGEPAVTTAYTATGVVAQRIDYDEWGVVIEDTAPGLQPPGVRRRNHRRRHRTRALRGAGL